MERQSGLHSPSSIPVIRRLTQHMPEGYNDIVRDEPPYKVEEINKILVAITTIHRNQNDLPIEQYIETHESYYKICTFGFKEGLTLNQLNTFKNSFPEESISDISYNPSLVSKQNELLKGALIVLVHRTPAPITPVMSNYPEPPTSSSSSSHMMRRKHTNTSSAFSPYLPIQPAPRKPFVLLEDKFNVPVVVEEAPKIGVFSSLLNWVGETLMGSPSSSSTNDAVANN